MDKEKNKTEQTDNSVTLETLVIPKIAEAEEKVKGYAQIIDWILKNHYKFGEMEVSLLKKIETIGKKYNF